MERLDRHQAFTGDVKIPLAFRRIQAARLVGWSGEAEHSEFQELCRATVRAPYSTSNRLAVCHFPLVKSGNGTGTLPPATDFSESGETALLVTES